MHPELDKTKLLELMRTEYMFVERTLARLTETQMLEPNAAGNAWSVKDTIAHLTRWTDRVIGWLDKAQHGENPDIPETGYTWDETDPMNDSYVEKDKDLPLEKVLAEFQRSHMEILEDVEALTEEMIFDSNFGGLLKEPPNPLIAHNTYLHYLEHIIPIRKWMIEKGYA